jgi:hypothetical protein
MEPRFIVHTVISEELIALLTRMALTQPRMKRARIIRIVLALFFLPFMLLRLKNLLCWSAANSESSFLLIGILLGASAVLLYSLLDNLFFLRLRIRRKYRKLYKNDMGSTAVHTFYDDHYTGENSHISSTAEYDLIESVNGYRDAVGLFCPTQNKEIVLPVSAFTLGTAEQLYTFLTVEKGKPHRKLR